MSTLIDFETYFPWIKWREPIPVQWPGIERFACRICIANLGLKKDSPHQWASRDEAQAHIAREHTGLAS